MEKQNTVRMEKVGLGNLREFLAIQISPAQRKILHTSSLKTFLQSIYGFWYSRLFLIRHETQAVGYLLLFCNPFCRKYNIGRLAIDQRFQRHGFGRSALLWGIEQLAATGTKRILLSVHPDNTPAIKLYESVGFVFTGGCWGDEAVMKYTIC